MTTKDFDRFSNFSGLAESNLAVHIIICCQVNQLSLRYLTVENRPFQSWVTTQ